MKTILILILSLWSLISSAQLINETYKEPQLSNATLKTSPDTIAADIHSEIAIDSSAQQQLSHYKIWAKLSLFEIGFGGSSLKSELLNNKTQFDGFVQTSLIPFSIGFYSLSGWGFGTKVAEYFDLQDKIEVNSYVPIYTYFPIYISNKQTKKEGSIPSMLNLYAGGSLWCASSGSSSSPEIMRASKYFHVGLNYMFFNYSVRDYPFGNGNFSVDAGMLFYETKGTNFKTSFHIGLLYNFAGVVVKSN